jgi:hypothetical protein
MFAEGPAKSLSSGKGAAWGSGHQSLAVPGTEFYNSGSFDYSNPNANGLFNANAPAYGVTAQTFASYETPTGGALVSDITIYELAYGATATTATFTVEDAVVSGVGGTVVKTGTCVSITQTYTGVTGFGYPIFAIDCEVAKKDADKVKLKSGVSYWINVLPTYPAGLGYLADVEDMPDATAFGGSTEFYSSYFEGPDFGYTWSPTGTYSGGGACGGIGCDAFAFSLSQ